MEPIWGLRPQPPVHAARPRGLAAAAGVDCRPMSSQAPRPTADEILEHALQLPKEQRLRLADELLDSVEGEEQGTAAKIDPELREELIRRLKKIEDGTAVLLDGDEVMRELRAKFER